MAKLPSTGSKIWLDQYDLTPFLSAGGVDLTQELPVVTCLSDAGPRRLPGNYDYKLSQQGFFDAASLAFDPLVFAALFDGSDHYISQMHGSSAEGQVSYDCVSRLSGSAWKAANGGAHMLDMSAEGSNELVRGLIFANASISATGTRTGRNQGAKASGSTFAVIFRLMAFSGTNITLKLQESSDDGGGDAYADIAGLTSGALTAIGVVRATTTAAIEAYRRVIISGTFTTATIGVTGGVVAGS